MFGLSASVVMTACGRGEHGALRAGDEVQISCHGAQSDAA
jgi:hypothetical protein